MKTTTFSTKDGKVTFNIITEGGEPVVKENKRESKQKEFYYFRESALQSIIADTYMFGLLFGGLLLTRFVFESRWYLYLFFIIMFFIVSAGRSSKRYKIFTNLEEFKKHVKDLK